MSKTEKKLADLGLSLPQAAAPVASYVPFVISGDLIIVSGQLPMRDGKVVYTGKVGGEVTEDDAKQAAQLCALNLLAQAKAACGGDLDKIDQVVRLGVFVQSADNFFGQPAIANGASDVMVQVFGDAGKHARAAVGVNALPLNAAVEIDAIFRLKN